MSVNSKFISRDTNFTCRYVLYRRLRRVMRQWLGGVLVALIRMVRKALLM